VPRFVFPCFIINAVLQIDKLSPPSIFKTECQTKETNAVTKKKSLVILGLESLLPQFIS